MSQTANLKGKILNVPYPHIWFKIPEGTSKDEDYKYTCEKNKEWTPYNSNLHMQGIKVIVNNPVPEEKKQNPDSFEDTLLLLDIMKEKRMKEMKTKKDDMIRQMALEQKKKLEEKRQAQVLIKTPMF